MSRRVSAEELCRWFLREHCGKLAMAGLVSMAFGVLVLGGRTPWMLALGLAFVLAGGFVFLGGVLAVASRKEES